MVISGAIFRDYPTAVDDKKSVRKVISNIFIPDKDENISSREVRNMSICYFAMNNEISQRVNR